MKHKIYLLLLICLISSNTFSQEVLLGLFENANIKKHIKESYLKQKDTFEAIKLPFIDEFSKTYFHPEISKWEDKDVYVNSSYAINSLTFGVATFDAFDENGNIYEDGSHFPFIADSLTSRAIRLDSVFTGTPDSITIADSIYLSFYYQPQGLGEAPESHDSLILQLYNPVTDKWNTVWAKEGMTYQNFENSFGIDFKSVMLPITNPDYISKNFKFRFYNIASLPNDDFPTWVGNVDHWNIDYVYLNIGRNINDTLPVDLAFRQRVFSLLKNYQQMPWNQFLINDTAEMKDSISIPYSNYSSSIVNLTEVIIITDISGTTPPFNSGISASNLNPFTDTVFFRSPIPYVFNSGVTKNADFDVKFIINTMTIPDWIRNNDTMQFNQRFYNYYAYDDGSPEAGYVLMGTDAMLAYQFVLNTPDTLRAVQMQFNRVKNNVNEDLYFSLVVWNDNNGIPGSIKYEQTGLQPVVVGYNDFHNYILDEAIPVSGTFYVGWIQQSSDGLNIGFDRNNARNNRIFYNTTGTWYNSMYEGALMIRPILGSEQEPWININDYSEKEVHNLKIYPNPAKAGSTLFIKTTDNDNIIVEIFDITGKLIHQSQRQNTISTANLNSGVYIVKVTNSLFNTTNTTKLVIIK